MAKIQLIITTLAAVISIIDAQCSVERAKPYFQRSVYEFSSDLINRIGQETDYHFVASPFSIYNLITFVSLAADRATLTEIQRVLRHHPHKCFTKRFFDIVKEITKTNDDITIEKSSALFIDSRMEINQSFKNSILKHGVCDITSLPMDNFDSAAAAINEYVNLNTHGNIDQILAPGDLEGVFLIFIDALFFKGNWRTPFPTSDTELSSFYDDKKRQLGDVNLMFLMGDFYLTNVDQINAKVLELPYGKSSNFSMLVFLPNDGISVQSVVDNLKKVSLRSIFRQFMQEGSDTVSVQMPRFKISSDLENLKELLSDMGLRSMFDRNYAEFPLLSDYLLYISNLIQKVEVEVTEEGTTASAATAAEFSSRSMPRQFLVNKPFLFMVVDKSSDFVLFLGAYSKPTVY